MTWGWRMVLCVKLPSLQRIVSVPLILLLFHKSQLSYTHEHLPSLTMEAKRTLVGGSLLVSAVTSLAFRLSCHFLPNYFSSVCNGARRVQEIYYFSQMQRVFGSPYINFRMIDAELSQLHCTSLSIPQVKSFLLLCLLYKAIEANFHIVEKSLKLLMIGQHPQCHIKIARVSFVDGRGKDVK